MTCREKLALEYPKSIHPFFDGGCAGCPHEYGYLERPDYCDTSSYHNMFRCGECWSREIPENNEKEKQEMNENTWTPTQMPEIEAPRTRTSREIEEEMLRLRAEHRDRIATLAKELEEVKKIEALEEAAAELKRVVDAYVKAGFTREEALALVNNTVKALAP